MTKVFQVCGKTHAQFDSIKMIMSKKKNATDIDNGALKNLEMFELDDFYQTLVSNLEFS